jgi:hypothetical protein
MKIDLREGIKLTFSDLLRPKIQHFYLRFQLISNDCIHTLSIKNLNLKDAAEFIVQIEELSSKCNLTIKQCEKLPRIDLDKIPKSIKIKAGKDIDLEIPFECKINDNLKFFF